MKKVVTHLHQIFDNTTRVTLGYNYQNKIERYSQHVWFNHWVHTHRRAAMAQRHEAAANHVTLRKSIITKESGHLDGAVTNKRPNGG